MEVAVAVDYMMAHVLLDEQKAFEEVASLPNQRYPWMRVRVHEYLLIVVMEIKDIDFGCFGLVFEFVGVWKVRIDYQIVPA